MEHCKERLSDSSISGAVPTSDSKHSTRSKIKTSQEKRICFICDEKRSIDSNQFNQGGLGRCYQESSAQKLISRMQRNLVDMIVTGMLVQNAWNYYLLDRPMIFLL